MNLLIVDDIPTDLKLLRAQLEAEGHAVFGAHDGVDALALLERQRVDVVISDVLMPRMDGYRLCHEIRKHARLHDLPIIIYTSTYTSPGDEKLARDVGADKYLKKPASVETIITALHEVIAMPHAASRPEALQEIEVLKQYSGQLVSALVGKTTKLQAAEGKFRALVEQTIVGIYIIQDDQFVYVNPGMAGIFGRSVDEMTSRTLYDFLVPEDQALARENIRKRISGGVPSIRYSLRVLHQSGAVLQVEVHSSRTDYNGRPAVMGVLVDITERKRAEEALRLQSTALTAAANAILIANRDGTIVWVNPAFTTLTGYTLAEAAGKNSRDLVKSGKQEREVYQQLWETILSGRTWRGQLVNRRKDGSFYPEEQTITPVRDAAGEITHFIAIKQDLSERKHAEEALRASERKFQSVFEQAAVGVIIVKGSRSQFVNVNRRFCEMVGYSAEELLQLSSHDITHPDDIAADTDQLEQISFGIIREFSREKRYRRKDGSFVWAKTFVAPLDPTEAKPTLRIGVIVDITERKQAEVALRASEERYRLLFERAPDIIFALAPTGAITSLNHAFETITGWSPAQWLGRPFQQFIHPDDETRAGELFQVVLRGERVPTFELRVRTAVGGHRDIEFTGFSSQFSGGRIEVQGIGRDITERKQIERQMLRTQRLETIGTLAGGIAHDLNNSLAPIMISVEMLRSQYPRETQMLEIIQTSTKRAADMVKQLLTFAKGAEGVRTPLQPGRLVKEMKKIMEGSFPKNLQLVIKCDPKLPTVLGDATQLHQVLLNLCVNARDAMPQGGTLTLEAVSQKVDATYASSVPDAKPGDYVALRVRDTGTGIPPEILDRILEPFFTTKSPEKGTGLGLSTVMGIVKGHDGFLQIHSQPGQGSEFTAFLPVHSAGSDTEHVIKAAAGFRGQGETILFVEDDASVRKVGCAVLRRMNFNPLAATDGADGLIRAAENRTELRAIITDVHMPHMDGLAFVRALRLLLPDIPIIVASGRMEDAMVEEFKTLGVTSRLDKPFTEAQLAEALKTVFKK